MNTSRPREIIFRFVFNSNCACLKHSNIPKQSHCLLPDVYNVVVVIVVNVAAVD